MKYKFRGVQQGGVWKEPGQRFQSGSNRLRSSVLHCVSTVVTHWSNFVFVLRVLDVMSFQPLTVCLHVGFVEPVLHSGHVGFITANWPNLQNKSHKQEEDHLFCRSCSFFRFKETVQPRFKNALFPLLCAGYSSRMFWCESPSFEDLPSLHFCMVLKAPPKNTLEKVGINIFYRKTWPGYSRGGRWWLW